MSSSGAQRARKPIAGAWVTAANLSNTGTATVETAVIVVPIPANISAWVLEVQFTHVVTAGTGTMNTWVRLEELQGDVTVADGAYASNFYTGASLAGTVSRSRTVRLSPSVLPTLSGATDFLNVYVRANGSAADTALSVTGIQARLIYTPL